MCQQRRERGGSALVFRLREKWDARQLDVGQPER